ncbi:unnamed protein product [Kuraishia capsulata CBS 1993]|uniref:Glutathione synthetase n=1 Tax=Kuraishia capsulata CBS 1993 TaxID=1382522 RepID=W6MJL9_9ASCO|nr:uncharacterized protein KUCA_T00000623001 [Kuraishia capsulata CBS 1993]CDK24657.1 unnamed protein product [Kuraishia capsulata CBS 1993]
MPPKKSFPQLSKIQEVELIDDLSQWALGNGLVMYPKDFKPYNAAYAPVTLFPTPFPRSQFEKGIEVAEKFGELYAKVTSNYEWLSKAIEELSQFDKGFTGKLWEVYLKAREFGIVQTKSLGLFRSDYMLDTANGEERIKQVEFNTVSISFGGLSSKVGELHSFLNSKGDYSSDKGNYYRDEDLPVSDSIKGLSEGLAQGVRYYESSESVKDTVVLFVVQHNERNVFDQRLLEYELLKSGIKSKRLTLSEVESSTAIDEATRALKLKSTGQTISVVYYRSAYAPYEFTSEKDWHARYYLEITRAVKCPSLLTQLSGAKKIQQVLTSKAVLGQFLDKESIDTLHDTFVAIHPMDDSEEGLAAQKLAFAEPERFVLKPQREGGGNNIYKQNIPEFLEGLPKSEWPGYILMELIHPPTLKNKILRDGVIIEEGILCELGIFNTVLFDESDGQILYNKAAGYLLRSKTSSSDEGGVAAGFGCVDSVYLY